MTTYQVWSEGYVVTGMESGATLLGTVVADTFDEAVQKVIDLTPEENRHFYYKHPEASQWRYWGCRLFDNEADARKSFG
jgi:hypothetical protein